MATSRYYGRVGYGFSEEKQKGVWDDRIVERKYYGDIVRSTRILEPGARAYAKVNDDIRVGNSISIVADPYALEHFFAIRYIEWTGALWNVLDVEVQSPRLLLRLGGVYNGPTAPIPGDARNAPGQ